MGKKVEDENLPSVVMPSCEMRKILTGQKALAYALLHLMGSFISAFLKPASSSTRSASGERFSLAAVPDKAYDCLIAGGDRLRHLEPQG